MRLVDIEPYEDCRIVLNNEDQGFPCKELPTVDVRVMCKECKHSGVEPRDMGGFFVCPVTNAYLEDSDSCSRGRRRGKT